MLPTNATEYNGSHMRGQISPCSQRANFRTEKWHTSRFWEATDEGSSITACQQRSSIHRTKMYAAKISITIPSFHV